MPTDWGAAMTGQGWWSEELVLESPDWGQLPGNLEDEHAVLNALFSHGSFPSLSFKGLISCCFRWTTDSSASSVLL